MEEERYGGRDGRLSRVDIDWWLYSGRGCGGLNHRGVGRSWANQGVVHAVLVARVTVRWSAACEPTQACEEHLEVSLEG